MLSYKNRRNLFRIIPFGVIWLTFSLVYTLLEKGLLGNLNYYPSTGNAYSFSRNILATPLSALITGLLIGVLEIFYFRKWFAHKSFSAKILYKSFIYLFIIFLFLAITFITSKGDIIASISGKSSWIDLWAFFTHYSLFSVIIFIASIIIVTQFYNEVSESLGNEELRNFFMGKYYRPIQEDRVFMFLDMKSSTQIAEKLGHMRYFEMLKEYFADLSAPVVNYGAEIYQYAGDEMILSWKLEDALSNNNCIECFFAMKKSLSLAEKKYYDRFALLPTFKAGLHCGKVTTGEIGVLKKEIIFTGDVLNTTARIQAMCNSFNVDNLLSGNLVEKLELTSLPHIKSLGENKLKGKDELVNLFTVADSFINR